jgi:tRNA-specific 2-thiouridylase
LAGRTPNPCILCNTHIKWEALLRRADQLDCEFIATGHYAQVREEDGRYIVSKGLDENKDQSYVLWGVSQQNLSRTKFPIGTYKKDEIRQIALDNELFELANKGESYEICFIPDNDYRGFLKRRRPEIEKKVSNGLFVDKKGEILGKHSGYPFFTVGQRKGLGIAFGEPMYVAEIKPETNMVVLGREDELGEQNMWVRDVNWVKYQTLIEPIEAITKIRYKDKGTNSRVEIMSDKTVKVQFYTPVDAIAPGQSSVFYEGQDVVGGGFIARKEEFVHNKIA